MSPMIKIVILIDLAAFVGCLGALVITMLVYNRYGTKIIQLDDLDEQ